MLLNLHEAETTSAGAARFDDPAFVPAGCNFPAPQSQYGGMQSPEGTAEGLLLPLGPTTPPQHHAAHQSLPSASPQTPGPSPIVPQGTAVLEPASGPMRSATSPSSPQLACVRLRPAAPDAGVSPDVTMEGASEAGSPCTSSLAGSPPGQQRPHSLVRALLDSGLCNMDAVLALVDEVEGWPRMALTELPGDADWQSRMPVLCALVASILVRVFLLCLLLLQQRGRRLWA